MEEKCPKCGNVIYLQEDGIIECSKCGYRFVMATLDKFEVKK